MSSTSKDKRQKILVDKYSYYQADQIGKGFSSQVYFGKKQLTGQKVAIKVIDKNNIHKDIQKKLLTSQLKVIKQIQNQQNIINIYDVYDLNKKVLIVTELCQSDLKKDLQKTITFDQKRAINILKQIIKGFQNLYKKGIIHRDLKPANLFLKNNIIKIADFGFAIKQNQLEKYDYIKVGSPAYMSPQSLQVGYHNHSSDIWSIGVIYFEMLCGKTPWSARCEIQLIQKMRFNTIDKCLPAHLSKISKQFLLKTLAFDRNCRISPQQLFQFEFQNNQNSIRQCQTSRTFNFSSPNIKIQKKNNSASKSSKLIKQKKQNSLKTPKGKQQTSQKSENDPQKPNKSQLLNSSLEKMAKLKDFYRQIKQTSQLQNKNLNEIIINKFTQRNAAKIRNITLKNKILDLSSSISPKKISPQKQKSLQKSKKSNAYANRSQSIHKLNATLPQQQKMAITNQLLSKIHFCRFTSKILRKVNKNIQYLNQKNISRNKIQKLQRQMYGLILTILSDVVNLSYYKKQIKQKYYLYSEYQKILHLVKKYQIKYQQQIKFVQSQWQDYPLLLRSTKYMIISLYKIIKQQEQTSQIYKEVIIIDLLITFLQILQLLKNKNNDKLLSKDKMEKIVQGRTKQIISKEHIQAIQKKLQLIKII